MKYLLPGDESAYLKMRIDGVAEATSRARWIFAWTLVACMVQLVALWNFNLSWLRTFVEQPLVRSMARGDQPILPEALSIQWVESLFFNVPIIGIKASVTDLGILGAFALLLLSTWKLYAVRRENYLIEDLLTEVSTKLSHCKSYVYFGIVSHQLFGSITPNVENRRFGDSPEPQAWDNAKLVIRERRIHRRYHRYRMRFLHVLIYDLAKVKAYLKQAAPAEKPDRNARSSSITAAIAPTVLILCMFFLPSLTAFAAFVSDFASLYGPSIFRRGGATLVHVLYGPDYFFRMTANAAFAVVLLRITVSAYRYQLATVEMIQDAYDSGWDILREG
jgi:hypothetical protein